MAKKVDWMSEPSLTGSIVVAGLPSTPGLVTAERNRPGCAAEKSLKKTTARSAAFGSGVAGLSFMNCATIAGCALDQVSTYGPCVGSPVTQAWANELCASAHWATI